MKKFKFRLERVLEYRDSVKKEKERELALRNAELREQEGHLTAIMAAQEAIVIPERREMTMAELTLTGDYLRFLQNALVHQRLMVHQAQDAVEGAREAYIEKAIEAKTIEELKDKRLDQYKDERRKHERKELDKLTVQRHRLTSKTMNSE